MTGLNQVDLVSSRVFPTLERKAGGPDNWVEAAGGLPHYIDAIAKHLHYEKGMTISRSIAVAVNTVKRWARGGTVTENGTTKHITPKTQAKAAVAVAEWEAKKLIAKSRRAVNLSELTREQKIFLIDLAMTKDGRKSYKKQGKWGHGFVPLDAKARESKAKGSSIAAKRINRLFNKPAAAAKLGTQMQSTRAGSTERVLRAAQSRRATMTDSSAAQKTVKSSLEKSKGGGGSKRSEKPWASIPESQKVTRNGKRYVQSIYRGATQLVEWTGTRTDQVAPDVNKRVLVSIRPVDARRMTTAQIRKLLKTKGQPKSVKKVLAAILREKEAAAK